MTLGVVASNSRSALIGSILAIVFIIAYEVIKQKNVKLLFAVSIISTSCIAFSIAFLNFNPLGRIASITSKTETSVTTRIEVWKDSIDIISGSPFFPGRLVTNYGGFPHNIFVELATGFGLPIAMLVLGFLLYPIAKVPHSRRLLLFGAIYILYFMRATTSGGLFQLSEMFSLAIIVSSIYKLGFHYEIDSRDRASS
jgi:O-antigen ligase